ncbi:ankyrin repeat domain-containing protein SOWAHB-like [Brienomyrus brachyistius]|uniref:ankyrin repeat domain-containing protein SOWAHB-like n=1 Tax=Brienomyrus brachyistius TaxID=42636 RepID=UPI0020B438B8|nr:ankyrin repeat domain-containing protein SOWAHB-like [Brienomyrus brachyistius]
MSVNEETLLTFLLEQGGAAEYTQLVSHFRPFLDNSDPAKKELNRELFKRCVNNVATVKQFERERYIVIRKQYVHLLTQSPAPVSNKREPEHISSTQNALSSSESAREQREGDLSEREGRKTVGFDGYQILSDRSTDDVSQSATMLNRQRRKEVGSFKEEIIHAPTETLQTKEINLSGDVRRPIVQKPYMLPLRMPPVQMDMSPKPNSEEEHLKKIDINQNLCEFPENNVEPEASNTHLSQVIKDFGSSIHSSELRYSRTIPLQSTEHEWLVKIATGHWTRVHCLLLQDTQLAEKRDFTSGFTVLHWAAKSGNCEMIAKILEISRRGGREIDVNCKTFGGYTPLHIAAIHHHEAVVTLLMSFGANRNIRDNDGKKACHYLHEGVSRDVRELLGGPGDPGRGKTQGHSEVDYHFDLAAGFNTISRLLQPYVTGHKKRHKRPELYTASDD